MLLFLSPKKYGLLDPATSDGRVIFFLPWEGKTIVGTTDRKCDVTYDPKPSEEEIEFVLKETQKYLNPDLKGTFSHFFVYVNKAKTKNLRQSKLYLR